MKLGPICQTSNGLFLKERKKEIHLSITLNSWKARQDFWHTLLESNPKCLEYFEGTDECGVARYGSVTVSGMLFLFPCDCKPSPTTITDTDLGKTQTQKGKEKKKHPTECSFIIHHYPNQPPKHPHHIQFQLHPNMPKKGSFFLSFSNQMQQTHFQ